MANFLYALHDNIDEKLIETVIVPSGQTWTAGDVCIAEALVSGSKKVYTGALVGALTDDICFIPDQKFEQLADGRRPDGGNMLTDISFKAGESIVVIRANKNMKYEIAVDKLDNTGVVAPAVGVFLIAQVGDAQLKTVASLGGTEAVALKIEALASVPTGGQMGLGFSSSVIARVIKA